MVSGSNSGASKLPFTRKERITVGVVALFLALMGLGSHFFNFPPASPDVPVCQMAGNCGSGDPLWNYNQ